MDAPETGVLTEAFEAERRGLLVHAYRTLGAYHEAEDVALATRLCVEVADNLPGRVMVRDTKDRGGGALTFAPTAWRAFVGG